jgi:trehalose/maltose transport system permease protein
MVTQNTSSQLTRSRVKAAWLFITPALLVLALVAGWPLMRTIWFGFTDGVYPSRDFSTIEKM